MKEEKKNTLEDQVVFRRHQRRRTREWMRSVLLGIFLSSIVFGVYFVVYHTNLFVVEKFEVVGMMKQRTIADVIRSAQVPFQSSLFRVSLKRVREQILRDPWIRDATVRRVPPDSLWIYITEYEPVALCLLDRLYFVSNEGVVFKPMEQEKVRDLPVITGLRKSQPELIQKSLELFHLFETEFVAGQMGISEVHYDYIKGFSLVTLHKPMFVRLGFEPFTDKLGRLERILTYAQEKRWQLSRVELDYLDKAFVRWKQI